jgi:hypothetical protein
MRILSVVSIAYGQDFMAMMNSLSNAATKCVFALPVWLGCFAVEPPIPLDALLPGTRGNSSLDDLSISEEQYAQLCGTSCAISRRSTQLACKDLADDPSDYLHVLGAALDVLCSPCGKVLLLPIVRRLLQDSSSLTSLTSLSSSCIILSDPCRAGRDDNLPLCGDDLEAISPGCKDIMGNASLQCAEPEARAAWDLVYGLANEALYMCYSDSIAALKYAANCVLPAAAPSSFVAPAADFTYTPADQCPQPIPTCTAAPTAAPTVAPTPAPTPAPTLASDPEQSSSEAAPALLAGLLPFFLVAQ